MNRLKLDFSLQTAEERNDFLSTYLVQFNDLTPQELETIANYLLWGKTSTGEALGSGIDIKTKNGIWDKRNDEESLEALLENPGFNDASLHPLRTSPPTKIAREVFSRSEARRNAPPHLLRVFEELWARIDRLDLLLNFYDLKSGKRIKPPREELLNKFSEEEQNELREAAESLNQYTYLKKRHELVELRREQYTLKDSYSSTILVTNHFYQPSGNIRIVFDEDLPIYPLGLYNKTEEAQLIFNSNFDPRALNDRQLQLINNFYWKKIADEPKFDRKFDFRNLENVYQVFLNYFELLDQFEENREVFEVESNSNELIQTLHFYIDSADLTEIQKEILERKTRREDNKSIAATINEKYGKNYTANYISTIFRQKIIVKINEAAEFHRKVIENCFFPENFKKCTSCGRILLLDTHNFVRKSRSKDGFNSKCKRCEKLERQRKKEEKNG